MITSLNQPGLEKYNIKITIVFDFESLFLPKPNSEGLDSLNEIEYETQVLPSILQGS